MARKQVSERQQYLNQEYARLRRNLLQRLRRREKAGAKVDWATVPRKPKKVTEASLNVFMQGSLIQQRTGEYKFKRGYRYKAKVVTDLSHEQYDQEFSDLLQRNRAEIERRSAQKTLSQIESSDEIPTVSVSYIDDVKNQIRQLPDTIGYYSGTAGQWIVRDNTQYINFLLKLVDQAVEEEGEERMNWYYQQKLPEIYQATDIENYPSDEEGVSAEDSKLADLIYPSTVTFDMWEALW